MPKTCNICNNSIYNPHRRIVGGKIVELCVAKCHDTHIDPMTNAGAFLADAKRRFRKAGMKRPNG